MKAPTPEQPLRLQDWSPDGRYLVFYSPRPQTQADLWWLSLADGRAEPLRQSPANEFSAQVSPDSHWVAYRSDETGQPEIFLQQFPRGDIRQKVSANGGDQPRWRRDGRELFYLSSDNDLVAVEIHPGSPPRVGPGQKLFHVALWKSRGDDRNNYAVSRDGSRFLFSVRPGSATPITVRLNWTAALHE